MAKPSARPNTSGPAVNPRADDVNTGGSFASPAAPARTRNGGMVGLNGDPDPLKLGPDGTVDPRPTGFLPPRTADELAHKNPFSG
jgi:hypothetical protein